MRDIFTEFRSLTDGDLTATETTSGLYLGAAAPKGTPVRIEVPAQDASGDTLVITFEESDTVGGTYRRIATAQPEVTGTTVGAAPKEIDIVINNVLDFVRMVFTVTGSSPNFGPVTAGVDLGGYQNVLSGGPATVAGGF